jgi:aspartate 1-decarboxylase
MIREMLKSKIHRATVTGADLNYTGSVSIDPALCEAVGLREYEKVDVLDLDNGARLSTYVILGDAGEVCLNGAAARLVQTGDRVIIVSYAQLETSEAAHFRPRVVVVDDRNRIVETLPRQPMD